MNKNCLSYWFPKLQAAGVPVPRTEVIRMPEAAHQQFGSFVNGEGGASAAAEAFSETVRTACVKMGFPCFLRTGQTSHKHDWKRTCFVSDGDSMLERICRLVEFSECADFLGLPWDVWAVREMLPTRPLAVLSKYGNFPLVKEVRVFVAHGMVRCWHPYWPEGAIRQGGCNDPDVIAQALDAASFVNKYASPFGDHWYTIASDVAKAFKDDEAFSVDLIPTSRITDDTGEYDCGWMVTDMALAARSFHWEGCPHAAKNGEAEK